MYSGVGMERGDPSRKNRSGKGLLTTTLYAQIIPCKTLTDLFEDDKIDTTIQGTALFRRVRSDGFNFSETQLL